MGTSGSRVHRCRQGRQGHWRHEEGVGQGRGPRLEERSRCRVSQREHSLHGVNNLERLTLYKESPDYSVMDIDFWYDTKNERLVVAHDKPTGKEPLLSEWLEEFSQLPPERRKALHLDMKNSKATKHLIKVLNKFKKNHPEIWNSTIIILNGDIPIGKSHRILWNKPKTWPMMWRKKLNFRDMKRLSEAFPEAVISLGISSLTKELDPSMERAIQRTYNKLPGVTKILSVPIHLPVSKELAKIAEDNDTLIKFWSGQSHKFTTPEDGEELRNSVKIAEGTPHWVEF